MVLCALILSIGSLWAERVTQEDAALVAANFLNAGDTTSQGAQAPGRNRPIRRVALAEDAQYYVYANANGEGWVMVAANDVVKPILAYSKTGTFSADKMPSNVSHWLGHYDKFIKKLEDEGVTQTEEAAAQWKKLRKALPDTPAGTIVVGPLIQTTWDQTAPYNNLCPGTGTYESGGTKAATGCVATAMAQVMNYWQWPVTGNGSRTYQPADPNSSPRADSKRYGQQTANFGETTYDWANMKNSYSGTSTSAQKTAVATLMFHCGVATDMMYGNSADGGSGTYTVNYNDWDWDDDEGECAMNAFVMFFRYKKTGLTGYMRDGYGSYYTSWTDAAWTNMIKTELDKQHPIMYGGSGTAGGHSFICDGYDDKDYFHFNWGWSGDNDGWYALSYLVPGSGGAGGGDYNFSDDQDAIIGIVPDKTEVTITWSVGGVTSTTTQTSGTLVLPATTPADCSGSGGKKFVGWTAQSSISNGAKPADLFTSGSGITVTTNKTYYAVYATASEGGGGGTTDITLSPASDTSFPKDGITLSVSGGALDNGTDYRVYKGQTLTITSSVGDMTNIALTYSGASNDGGGWASSYTPNAATWTSPTASGEQARITQIVVTVSGGGTSYSDYSLICGTPCSNTPSMSFSTPTTVSKTTADASFTKTVNISGKGSGQTVAYSSSDVTVATVDNSGVVTLKGKVGSTTITASVAANGDYCSASASYTLNVTAAPISVTLYYNNSTATLNNQTPPYTLPTGSPYNTAMCSGDWTFAGWYGSAYAKSETAPTYITQLSATGSAYAVYTTTETSGSGGAGGSVTITTSTANIPTAYGSANTFTEYTLEGYKFKIQQMYLNSGKLQWRAAGNSSGTGTMYNNEAFPGKITSIVLTYNSSDENKNFTVKVGSSANPTEGTSITPTTNNLEYTFDCSSANADYFVLANGSNAGYLNQIVINYASGVSSTTYYATTPECVTGCTITPTMFFDNATVNKTTDDETYTQAVNISGKGSGQTVAYSSSNENIATVNASGVVTLKGVVGSTTITASVTADGDYCAASASYTLTVTAAPIDVTLHYNGGAATLSDQTPPYTLPTTSAYTVAMCDGDWTFAGWYGSEYAKSTTAPTYITQLNATGHAYAVYTTTETVSSAPARAKAEANGTKTFAFATIASANNWENSVTYDTVEDAPVTITAEGGGNNGKWYSSGSGSWRMYNGGTVRITVEGGAVTSVTSSPTCDFTISDGEATFSPSARTDFTQIVVNYTTSGGGGGPTSTTYYATTPECASPQEPCALTSITLNTTSAKKTFFVGEQFTYDNVVVTANYSNCDSKTVNGFYTVPDMSSAGTKTVNISYTENGVTKEATYEISIVCELESITLNTSGAKTSFIVGEQFTYAGVVVTAHYKSNNCADQTVNGFYSVPSTATTGTKTVNVSYTENGITKEASYNITVEEAVTYTVTWKACGEVFDSKTYQEGAALVLPTSTPGGNAGKSFVGWTATAHYTGASAPPDLFSTAGDKTVTGNVTYYAVYE